MNYIQKIIDDFHGKKLEDVNPSKILPLWKLMGVYFLISTPFVYIAFLSRIENIFNIEDHSYIEHFIYGVFGVPFISAVLLFIPWIALYFKKAEDIRCVKVNFIVTLTAIVLICTSYLSEFERKGNLVNHFYFDVFSISIGVFLMFSIYKNIYIKH